MTQNETQKTTNKEVRVRMAPSPTGTLHIGTARTAIFNWLFARHHGGTFILRIEDTDTARSEARFEDDIISNFKWLGIDWEEFYRQSDRMPIYRKYIERLLAQNKAFWCYHTPEELEAERQQQTELKQSPQHVCEFKDFDATGKKHKTSYASGVIRLRIDTQSERKIAFNDLVRGEVEFEERLLGDFSIAKGLDEPLYNLAVVIDDYEMNITHVIRGEDHISNTPKQILIQEALGFYKPVYAHVPLMLAPDRSKLSKRHGATSVTEYRSEGYLPDAIFNYLALLGFTANETDEILNKDGLAKIFDATRIHKSGAIFDIKKLDWTNGEYIKKLSNEQLANGVESFLNEDGVAYNREYLLKVAPLARERMKKLSDIREFSYFFKEPDYSADLLDWKARTREEIAQSLSKVHDVMAKTDFDNAEVVRKELDALGQETGDRGLVYWPFRVALTGQKASPDPVDIALALGKTKTLARVNEAIKKIS